MKVTEWRAVKLADDKWVVADESGVFCTLRRAKGDREYAYLIALAPRLFRLFRLAFKIGLFFDWASQREFSQATWAKRMGIVAGIHAKMIPLLREWREAQDRMFYGCDSDRAAPSTGFIPHDPENTTTGFINGDGN